MTLFLQLAANGLINASMFGILAIGFGVIYRGIRVFHLAFGPMFAVSAFFFHFVVTVCDLNYWVAGVITVLFSALAGWLIEWQFYSAFYRRRSNSGAVLVASLGIGIAIENVLALAYGNEIYTIARPFLGSSIPLGQISLTSIQWSELAVCNLLIFVMALVQRTTPFKIIKVMGDNPELLQVLGWRMSYYRAGVLALGTALAAVPACFTMLDVGLDVHSGMTYVLIAAVAVLAGGVSRMSGWVIGAAALALLQSIVVWKVSAKWMDLVAFVVLLTVLVIRRNGLIRVLRRSEEL